MRVRNRKIQKLLQTYEYFLYVPLANVFPETELVETIIMGCLRELFIKELLFVG